MIGLCDIGTLNVMLMVGSPYFGFRPAPILEPPLLLFSSVVMLQRYYLFDCVLHFDIIFFEELEPVIAPEQVKVFNR
jgi:hypothetical protein